jgi:hypothetical protein
VHVENTLAERIALDELNGLEATDKLLSGIAKPANTAEQVKDAQSHLRARA